jgi:hypothetical protein
MRKVRPSPKEKRKETEVPAPRQAISYTQNMGGVDRHDQLRAYYTCARKSQLWWRQLLYFLVDAAQVNAFICFKHSRGEIGTGTSARCMEVPSRTPVGSSDESSVHSSDETSDETSDEDSDTRPVYIGSSKHSDFILDIGMGLIAGYAKGAAKKQQRPYSIVPVAAVNADEHELVHMDCKWPRQCVWCRRRGETTKSGNPIMSRFGCFQCDIHLCNNGSCFNEFHSAAELE